MILIKLTSGKYCKVDDSDYKALSRYTWWENCNGYAWRQVQKTINGKRSRRSIFMHRVIVNTPDGLDTDHINNDKLDNRKSNLRAVSRSINMLNTLIRSNNNSGTIGVSFFKPNGKWRSYITINGKQRSLGYFTEKSEAIKARKNALELL